MLDTVLSTVCEPDENQGKDGSALNFNSPLEAGKPKMMYLNRGWSPLSGTLAGHMSVTRSNIKLLVSRSAMLTLFVTLLLIALAPLAATAQDKQADSPGKQEEVDPATKHLIGAHGLYGKGLFKLAAEEYASFLKKYPEHKDATTATYAMGICQYRLQQFEDATKTLSTALKDAKFMERAECLAVLGHCYLQLKENETALKTFDTLLANHGDSNYAEGAALNKAQVLFMLEKKTEANAAAQAFVTKYPKSGYRATGLYTLALTQHSLGKFDLGVTSLTDLLTNHKTSPYRIDASLLLGQCHEGLNQFDAAAKSYREMLAIAPPTRQPEGHYRLAVVLHNTKKHDDAITQLTTLLSKFPTSEYAAPAQMQLGKTQYDANKLSDARKSLAKVVTNDKTRANEAKYWIAQCDIAEKGYATAIKTLDQLAVAKPAMTNADEIDFFRAVCRMQLGEFADAAKAFGTFRQTYAKDERLTEAAFHHAFCLHKLEKYDDSSKMCQIVKAGESTWHFDADRLWAENLFLTAKYEEASAKYADLQTKSKSADEQLQFACRMGQCAYFSNNFEQAATLLAKVSSNPAVAKHDELQRVIFLHGDALLQTKKYAEAIGPLKLYLTINKNDEEAHFKLGLAQLRNADEDSALATFTEVSKGKTDSPWVQRSLYEYGQLTYKRKDSAKAAAALKKVVAAGAPEQLTAPSMYLLAWIDFDAKKFDDAATAFKAMAAKYPKHELAADAVFQQGVSLDQSAQAAKDTAQANAKTAQAIDVLNAYVAANKTGKHVTDARHLIGSGYAKLGKHNEAVVELGALSKTKDGRTDSVLYDLAWSQRALKANDNAVTTYRALLDEFKTSDLATASRIELAELLYEKDGFAEAAALIETALLDKKGDPATLSAGQYRLGWCHLKLKKPDLAAASFAAFAAGNPADELAPSALYQAGMAFREVGKLSDASKHFNTLVDKHPKAELASVGLLRLAETQSETGDYDKSSQSYKKFVTAYPKSEYLHLAMFGIGWSHENLKQYDEARSWYRKTIDTTNTVTAARAQFQIGETYFKQQNYEPAAKELLKVDIVYDYKEWSAKALYEAGVCFEQLKRVDDARKQYEQCVKSYGDQAAAALCKKRLAALPKSGE